MNHSSQQPSSPGLRRRGKARLVSLFAAPAALAVFAGVGCGESGGRMDADPDPAVTETGAEAPEPAAEGAEDSADAPGSAEERRNTGNASVARIIDGDTLEVFGGGGILPADAGATVRLLEIDAPEVGTCHADEATDRLSDLLPLGSDIRIERDEDLKDPYGRYLLYVWNDGGEFVNEAMVSGGDAKATLYPPNDKHWPTISGAADEAEQVEAGLWAGCDETSPASDPADTPTDLPTDEFADIPTDEPADVPTDTPETEPSQDTSPAEPPAGGPDVDCSDLSGPTPVGPDDPYRLDRDGDGVGCDE
ncbi:thermonuclease family protein [Streptomyces sp. NPDC050315]|uniref:thermonuclease family protein n=1 Tax=Streptomyces sp. NPDC050315 TaxID=3155039 RepID=UPI00341581A4